MRPYHLLLHTLSRILSRIFFWTVAARLRERRLVNRCKRVFGKPEGPVADRASLARQFEQHVSAGMRKLNVGGGAKSLAGFINIDFVRHPTVEREICADILDLGFIPPESVEHIHSNHVLEHLSERDMAAQLRSYFALLVPEGLLTVRCPNALGAAFAFWFPPVHERGKADFVALGYPEKEDFGEPANGWAHRDLFGTLHWFFGDVGDAANQHLSLVTPTLLCNQIRDAGFEILKCTEPEALNIAVVAVKPGVQKAATPNLAHAGGDFVA